MFGTVLKPIVLMETQKTGCKTYLDMWCLGIPLTISEFLYNSSTQICIVSARGMLENSDSTSKDAITYLEFYYMLYR